VALAARAGRLEPRLRSWLRSPAGRVASIGAFLGAVALLGWVCWRAARRVDLSRLDPAALVAALVAAVAYWIALAGAWSALVGAPGEASVLATWSRSQLLRFVPGGLLAPAARASRVEGDVRRRVGAALAEAALLVSVGAAIAGVAEAWASGQVVWLALEVLPCVGVLALRFGRRRWLPVGVHPVAAGVFELLARVAYVLAALACQVAAGGGVSEVAVVGAAALSWLVGYVVPISPGGLGVREAVYAALLAGLVTTTGRADPALGALALRVVTSVAELVTFLVLGGRRRATPRSRPAPEC
jgi:hypothetical protein